jgi:hypothetical protein
VMVSITLHFLSVMYCYPGRLSVCSTDTSGFGQPMSGTSQVFIVGLYCTGNMWVLYIACLFYCVPETSFIT